MPSWASRFYTQSTTREILFLRNPHSKVWRNSWSFVLTLSHGQTSVDCGFSHNNTVIQTNMSASSVISKCLINDHMLFHKLKPYTIEITDPMMRAFKSSHLKHQLHLELEKKWKTTAKLTDSYYIFQMTWIN